MTEIQKFYAGTNIFVTGGTGFLGKVLIEKLLRSCPDVGIIYVLIRDKKGKSSRERVEQFSSAPVFDALREQMPNFAEKIVGIAGDASKPRLGMSASDLDRIANEVSVIFHLAATVRFDEKLLKAVAMNVNSTKEMIEIGRACRALKSAVYVSTAYSNCTREMIGEELYEPPLSYDEITAFVEIAERKKWSEEQIDGFAKGLVGKWPNTYTFTKAISEGVIAEYAKGLPFSIYRPSIVTTSAKEPFPGWADQIFGINGLLIAAGLGLMHVVWLDQDKKCDLVPVDLTCNALIACAWKTAIDHEKLTHRSETIVYNYVSGPDAPLTWGKFNGSCTEQIHVAPPNQSVYYISFYQMKSRLAYVFLEFWLQLVPALLLDNIGRLFRRTPKMYQLRLKVLNLGHALSAFTLHDWEFQNQRVNELWNKLSTEDKLLFPFCLKNFDWLEHIKTQVVGIRKYCLSEPDDTIDHSKRRYFALLVIHRMVQLLFWAFIFWITWKLVCWTMGLC